MRGSWATTCCCSIRGEWGIDNLPGVTIGSEPTWTGLTSPLGLAALAAGSRPDVLSNMSTAATSDQRGDVTYRQYVEQYLIPVARTDLLYDSVQVNSPITSISRTSCGSDPTIANEQPIRAGVPLVDRFTTARQYTQLVDIVLDCSGLADH
ncbi:MAG: hypothetical protein R3C56_01895 [Pirellulaceae bacterium]